LTRCSKTTMSEEYNLMAEARSVMVSWTGIKWIGIITVWFVSTILFTYGTCLHQGHCGTGPWNSISHSWENPPGSYLSRFVVGFACDMICVFHGLLYLANTAADRVPDTTRKCCGCFTNEVLLGVGLFACFCLSWVAAICDADTDPLCLGNNTIHSTCAILFFGLTDVVAAVMACNPKTEKARRPLRRVANSLVAGLMTLCTLVRLLRVLNGRANFNGSSSGWGPQDGDNFTIIAEVCEVTLFCVFMNTTARECFDGLSWAAVSTLVPDSDDRTVTLVAPARRLAQAGAALAGGVLAVSLVIGAFDGTLPVPEGQVPTLSDLGTHKPCNWLWRWGMVQACSAGLWVLAFSQVAVANGNPWRVADLAFLALGAGSLLCMAGMAIVNQDEQATYHAWLLAGFFALGDLYALGLVVVDSSRHSKKAATTAAPLAPQVFAVVAALSAIRGALPFFVEGPSSSLAASNAEAVLEWVNAVALIGFFYTNCASRDATKEMGLSFLVDDYKQQSTQVPKEGKKAVAVSSHTAGLV